LSEYQIFESGFLNGEEVGKSFKAKPEEEAKRLSGVSWEPTSRVVALGKKKRCVQRSLNGRMLWVTQNGTVARRIKPVSEQGKSLITRERFNMKNKSLRLEKNDESNRLGFSPG